MAVRISQILEMKCCLVIRMCDASKKKGTSWSPGALMYFRMASTGQSWLPVQPITTSVLAQN